MANRLKMANVNTIRCLLERGWSRRRIARELGVHRETVGRYTRAGPERDSKLATPTAGEKSLCEPYRAIIQEKLELGLSGQRIWQDLTGERGFHGSYESVKRFVRKLCRKRDLPFRRMECSPGEEAQVDFGTGAWVVDPGGRKRRPHVLRMVLSYSRRGYSEAVWRQDTESFLRCLENAFHHFGGVPKTLVIDNLRAGVSHADWYDPELNPKLEAFSRYYGTVILPTRPRTPRHKGKIERGVGYVRGNALKGHTFDSLCQASWIGPYSRHWTRRMVEVRGVQGVRVLLGLLALARDFPTDTIEKACQTALKHNLWRLKSLRRLCRDNPNQEELPFMEDHPLIRGLDAYATIARFPPVSFRPTQTPQESEESEEKILY